MMQTEALMLMNMKELLVWCGGLKSRTSGMARNSMSDCIAPGVTNRVIIHDIASEVGMPTIQLNGDVGLGYSGDFPCSLALTSLGRYTWLTEWGYLRLPHFESLALCAGRTWGNYFADNSVGAEFLRSGCFEPWR